MIFEVVFNFEFVCIGCVIIGIIVGVIFRLIEVLFCVLVWCIVVFVEVLFLFVVMELFFV